jgi:manganese/iron transport system permease protein
MSALLSCSMTPKGWALMGDALCHAVLPGVVLAYAAGCIVLVLPGQFLVAMLLAPRHGLLLRRRLRSFSPPSTNP